MRHRATVQDGHEGLFNLDCAPTDSAGFGGRELSPAAAAHIHRYVHAVYVRIDTEPITVGSTRADARFNRRATLRTEPMSFHRSLGRA
jgi:hypothetical protein